MVKAAATTGRAVARRPGWTKTSKAVFLDVLSQSCNVSEAARAAGMTGTASAYELRRRDPDFANGWLAALEQGYCELELLLLRLALFGSEQTETVEEGAGAAEATGAGQGAGGKRRIKTVHSYPYAMALQLLATHKKAVDAYRQSLCPGEEEKALRAELLARIDAMRVSARPAGWRVGDPVERKRGRPARKSGESRP